jgi:transposase InsO family protein
LIVSCRVNQLENRPEQDLLKKNYDLPEAQASIADCFDYYNPDRRHASIGYLAPYYSCQRQLANVTQFSPA